MSVRIRGWWRQTTTTLENEHARSCSRVVEGGVGGKQLLSSKTSLRARVRGWWKWWRWKTASTLENEHERSRSRVVGAGGASKQPPPSKPSMSARVRG